MANYAWKDNLACVSTWVIMSSPKFMDQLNAPFDKAEGKTMGQMRYWPKSPISQAMLDGLAWGMAQRFINHLVKTYTKKKQDSKMDSADIIQTLADVFANKKATLADLAEAVDSVAKFPDEK